MRSTSTPPPDARAELIRHEDRGEVLEAPPERLREHDQTPKALMFVRNNNPYPPGTDQLDALPLRGELVIGGLEGGPLRLDLARLPELPQVEVELVMQCAGNGRAFYAGAQDIEGSQWTRGGMLNARFGGVRLADALAGRRPTAGARHLTATGADGGEGYEKSVPLEDALARGLLAYRANGEPLSGAHGGPLRLVLPGYFGTVNVKWLRALTFTAAETDHEAQRERYRVPTPDGGSRPCWRQPIKSVVLNPCDGQRLPAGPVQVSGVAFNDGACPLSRVEVTADGGQTWHPAELEPERGPYAWRRWRLTLDLPPGTHGLGARATDAHGRRQPLDGDANHNPDGYEWHGVDRVRVEVVKG